MREKEGRGWLHEEVLEREGGGKERGRERERREWKREKGEGRV